MSGKLTTANCFDRATDVRYNGCEMEIFGIGIGEIMIIALVAMIVLGPDRLPEVARSLGRGVAEIRRATEPARSAWTDLTNEVNKEVNKATSAFNDVKSGNPWEVHPIMQNMTPEERERYVATGEMPPAVAEQLAQDTSARANGSVVPDAGVAQLEYPMPHEELGHWAAGQALPPMEELEYPAPGTGKGNGEIGVMHGSLALSADDAART